MSSIEEGFAAAEAKAARRRLAGAVSDLLERKGLTEADVGQIERVRFNEWQGFFKDEDGEAQVQDLQGVSIVLSPKFESGPDWPVIQPCTPVSIKSPKLAARKADGWLRAMTLPDMQIGYYRDARDRLHPTHDESAIDVTLKMVRFVRPDVLVLHGDNLDFPEFGKYKLSPAFQRTTQPTIERAGLLVAQLRAAAGDECEIVWLEGNHELRLGTYIQVNAMAAFALRRAGEPPGSWPTLSVPELCRLDEHGITYLPGYPANAYMINDRLEVIHGKYVNSNGSTAHKYLNNSRFSTVYGHIHRREWAERTRPGHNGPNRILAISPGCLCRIDGVVPSVKGGLDLDGIPIPSTEDWQQGVSVFMYEPGEGRFVPEVVPISDGWALYHNREFVSELTIEGERVAV